MKELANRIYAFIDKYAGVSPNWDGEDIGEKYTAPDVYEFLRSAEMLKNEVIPEACFSQWGSGGYKPYTSFEGKKEHDELKRLIAEYTK